MVDYHDIADQQEFETGILNTARLPFAVYG